MLVNINIFGTFPYLKIHISSLNINIYLPFIRILLLPTTYNLEQHTLLYERECVSLFIPLGIDLMGSYMSFGYMPQQNGFINYLLFGKTTL